MKQGSASPLRVGIVCADSAYTAGLAGALAESFASVSGPVIATRDSADLLVYAFVESDLAAPDFLSHQSDTIRKDAAPTKVFLELVSADTLGPAAREIAEKNKLVARLANDHSGYLVPLMSKFMRWDPARLLTGQGMPNRRGYQAIARTVAKFIDRFDVRRSLSVEKADAVFTPKVHAQEILQALTWKAGELPRMIKFAPDAENIADFLDGRASFPSYPDWGRVKFAAPIDWSMPGPNRSWQSYFLGLEFVGPSLGLCYGLLEKARLRDSAALLSVLEKRGVCAAQILARAGETIADFLQANPPDAPMAQRAWHEGTVCRRLKALLAYLICCGAAQRCGEKIDETAVELAFSSVLSSVDMLQREQVYIKSGNHGVRQDALLILVGMLFPSLDATHTLAASALGRLKRHQLETMLSPDGVWLENSFEYHRLVTTLLSDLTDDMRTTGQAGSDVLMDAIRRLLTFSEAVVTVDGCAPLIGDTTPREALSAIVRTRALFEAGEEGNANKPFERTRDTYLFPDSGYFASHSGRTLDPDGSSLIFYANLGVPKHKHADDLSVIFSHGAKELLVDGGTYNKETSDDVRNAARFDPATHNTYRVNGKGYSLRATARDDTAGIAGMWSGEGWAAAHGFNKTYPGARVDRFVIHLKRHNALIVVDKLSSSLFWKAAMFEQFWHIAPEFNPSAGTSGTLTFSSARDGVLMAAFDSAKAETAIEHGGPGNPIAWLMQRDGTTVPTPYIRRAQNLRKGTMASLFQWAPSAKDLSVNVSGANISAKGGGFNASFSVHADKVTCLRLEP